MPSLAAAIEPDEVTLGNPLAVTSIVFVNVGNVLEVTVIGYVREVAFALTHAAVGVKTAVVLFVDV
jgi:hypothetical protein